MTQKNKWTILSGVILGPRMQEVGEMLEDEFGQSDDESQPRVQDGLREAS
jgi:hypothetical protein